MPDDVSFGAMPGTYFCVRCDRNQWFTASGETGGHCQFCGHREHEPAAPGGLNPNREQLAAMRRRSPDA